MANTSETHVVEQPNLLGRLLAAKLPLEPEQFPGELDRLGVADLILADQPDTDEVVADGPAVVRSETNRSRRR